MRWLVVVVGTACAPSASPTTPTSPAVAKLQTFAEPMLFATPHAVAHYGEPLDKPATTPFDDAVIAASHTVADPRLFRACADLAVLADGSSNEPSTIATAAVEQAWTAAGLVEPPAAPVVIRTTDPHAVVTALGNVPPGAHVGLAHADDVVIAVVVPAQLEVAPFARRAPVDGGFTIDGKLAAKFQSVAVDVAWDDTGSLQLSPPLAAHRFSASIACQKRSARGRVVITGVDGPTQIVVARFPIWCGMVPPDEVTVDPLVDPSGDVDASKAAHRMFLRLQRDRVAGGLPAQTWDDRAAKAALLHAEDLRDAVRTGRAPEWRHSDFTVPMIVSNLTRAKTVDEAYVKMMSEPGRRANAMSRDMTAGGIGIASGTEGVYVAELFISSPPTIETSPTAVMLEHAIRQVDPDLVVLPPLSEIATEMAMVVRAGGSHDDMRRVLFRGRGRPDMRVERLFYNVIEARTLGEVNPRALIAYDGVIDYIGVGVAQGYHPRLGDHALWVVCVMARGYGLPKKTPQ